MHCNHNCSVFVSTGLRRRPALVTMHRLLEPHQVKKQRRVVRAPLVAKPGLTLLVSAVEISIQRRPVSRVHDMHVLFQSVTLDLRRVHLLTRPPDHTRDQPRLSASLRSRKQRLEPLILQVLDTIQVWILLLKIRRDYECRLPVISQALANLNHLPIGLRFIPRLNLVRQPDLQTYLNISPPQSLEQRQSRAEYDVGGNAVTLLNNILCNPVLNLGARPVVVGEDNCFYRTGGASRLA